MRTDTRPRPIRPAAYVERVNLAIDCVVSRLGEPGGLRLEEVSRAASLSPFHFHRVFQALMGETLADFVKRLRLEKALVMMCHGVGARGRTGNRGRKPSLTRVAMACGFSSSSDFSRCFKQRFGVSPSAFDTNAWREAHGAELQAMVDTAVKGGAGRHLGRLPAGANPDGFKVRVRDLPARTVAYIRVRNPYRGDAVVKAAQRLIAWAERNALADGQWLGYQWDNPEITPLDNCVYHIAVEVPSERLTLKGGGGEIGRFRFPPMVVAQVDVRGGIDLELRALQWLFGTWLPKSGYVPDDHPCFEAFIGRPFAYGFEHFELYAQLPVRQG